MLRATWLARAPQARCPTLRPTLELTPSSKKLKARQAKPTQVPTAANAPTAEVGAQCPSSAVWTATAMGGAAAGSGQGRKPSIL